MRDSCMFYKNIFILYFTRVQKTNMFNWTTLKTIDIHTNVKRNKPIKV